MHCKQSAFAVGRGETGEQVYMARPPNYGQERKDRERIKAAKKAEKLAAKAAARDRAKGEDNAAEDTTGDQDDRQS